MVLAPQLLALFGYHGALGVGLARVIFPTVVMLGLNGLQTAILNALDEFFLPGHRAGGLEHRDRRHARRSACRSCTRRTRASTPTPSAILLGTAVQLAIPWPAMRRLGPPAVVLRPARRGGAARLPADAAGHARPRPDQPQPARQHVVRGGHRPRPRPGGDRQGVPHLHAAAGHVLGGGRRRRCSRRSRGSPPPATDRASARSSARACGRSRSCCCRRAAISAAFAIPIVRLLYEHGALHAGRRRRRRRVASRRSRSGSPSTARCCCSTAPSSACRRPGCRPTSRSPTWRVNATLDWVLLALARRLEHPARDLDREHLRRLRCCTSSCARSRAASTSAGCCARSCRIARRDRARRRPSATASGASLDDAAGAVPAVPVRHAGRRPGRDDRRLRAGREGHGDRGARTSCSRFCAAAGAPVAADSGA